MSRLSQAQVTTLAYIVCKGRCLFIRKTRAGDMNLDKYLGIGGHMEEGESPEECIIREIKEESGLSRDSLSSLEYRGHVTFVSDKYGTEYMHVFLGFLDDFPGLSSCNEAACPKLSSGNETALPELSACDEGELPELSPCDETDLPELSSCDEGELVWIDLPDIYGLPVWEGDKIMFDYLFSDNPPKFFSLKLCYEGDRLASHSENIY